MENISIWGINLYTNDLSKFDIEYLIKIPSKEVPRIDWISKEIDRIWDSLNLDNGIALAKQDIGGFYSHPVWILNGIFSATDPVSIKHRESIGIFLSELKIKNFADYGGGFGELARRIRFADKNINVTIVEPYPSNIGINRVNSDPGIRFVKFFEDTFECMIAQDVLEHVENPIELALSMVDATDDNGYLLFANCFYPTIKCHLPSNFYLRHTFAYVAKGMGLKLIGRVPGAKHVLVFQKIGTANKIEIAKRQKYAKMISPIINPIFGVLRGLKNSILH